MLLCGTREAVRTRVNTPLRDQEAHDSCSGNLHARYLHRSGREWYSKTASNKLLCFKHFDRINKVSSYGSIGVRWIEVIGRKWETLDHNMNSSRNSILKGTREGTINTEFCMNHDTRPGVHHDANQATTAETPRTSI